MSGETTTYRLYGRQRLSTKKLMKMAKSGGWLIYRPDDCKATTEDEQTVLMADTYTGNVIFTKSGKDNWNEIQLETEDDSITAVYEELIAIGFESAMVVIDGTIH